MNIKLLLNQASFGVSIAFLIIALLSKDVRYILIGIVLIVYSENKIKKSKK
ncbi:hypothetical protein CPAL_20300 [Clostridium thermopalmarium DSM 5974]|uniref:Uncharacterized protein n=1 Tax=Clostridium thermopalmarium DSM 5974 TaxID=1121340 RepID=A0A2T0APJ2_9CLOT|nr:hypothetical protein CPAL_20300 [Clostridium thermopalmarium DSM 5974]PVZ28863.1 hypothetical protein LX19_00167 [Clostridium thermopalmarium DSM 5974]